MKLYIMQFLSLLLLLLSLSGPHTVHSNLLLRTLNLVSPFYCKRLVFTSIQNKNRIIVLYTLIFTFLDGRRKDKTTNQMKLSSIRIELLVTFRNKI